MNEKITIVTAFFDIGRDKFKKFERSSNKYFDYFTKWAKLKNDLVVFVENDDVKEAVKSFRESIELGSRTTIEVVPDFSVIEPMLLAKMNEVMDSPISKQYRLRPNSPDSSNAKYNFVMILKAWCLKYAVEKLGVTGQLAWMDFGFNHGGEVYSLESNWNVEWRHDFGSKITFFNLQKLDKRPIFDIVFSMDTYIMGSTIIVPDNQCAILWNLALKYSYELGDIGISDDDQVIWLMCIRGNPDMFDVKPVSGWHRAIGEYGCSDFILNLPHKVSKAKRLIKALKPIYEAVNYCRRIFSIANQWKQV